MLAIVQHQLNLLKYDGLHDQAIPGSQLKRED